MRHRLIACEVFAREFDAVLTDCPHTIDVDLVEQGLHDRQACKMSEALQERIDQADDGTCDAILLGYGLCNNGIAGLHTTHSPLIVPRAHDCITLFLGSRQRYQEAFKACPGSYYLTSGWLERAKRSMESLPTRTTAEENDRAIYNDYVEKFGEDNAQYLLETLHGWKANYGQMAFIDMDLGDTEAYRAHAQEKATHRDMEYIEYKGDLRLFRALVYGPDWDPEEFLILQPDQDIRPSYDEQVIQSETPVARDDSK